MAAMASACEMLVVGDVCVDLILVGDVRPRFGQVEQIVDDCSLELGGSGAIFASQTGKLGTAVTLAGVLGNDAFGDMVSAQLAAAGVETQSLQRHATLKTGIGVALSERNDRAILTYMGTIDALRPEDLREEMLEGCRHFHLASYFLLTSMRSFWPEWFALCRRRGVTTSLDTNWDPENRWESVGELLPYVDVFLPNENEAMAIARERTAELALDVLAEVSPLVVVKCGERGAIARGRMGRYAFAPDERTGLAERVIDTTGAGDNFDAGFLSGWMQGLTLESCVLLGHRCAVGSLAYPGGVRGQLRERLREVATI